MLFKTYHDLFYFLNSEKIGPVIVPLSPPPNPPSITLIVIFIAVAFTIVFAIFITIIVVPNCHCHCRLYHHKPQCSCHHSVRKDKTFGRIMTTIDRESIRHFIFMSALILLMFPSVRLIIFDFQIASSNNAVASFNFS